MSEKVIPITILTGFLGAGKTTLVNKIVAENPHIKFGLIINEFGEEGIDGSLVKAESNEEIVEISNGCLCCVARGDLLKSAESLINTGKVDYILIETSGLAEPMPVAQTFYVDDLGGRVTMDGIVCLVDAVNHTESEKNFKIAVEQLHTADIIVLNKAQDADPELLSSLKDSIGKINSYASILENRNDLKTNLIIETGKWSYKQIVDVDNEHICENEDCDCHNHNEGKESNDEKHSCENCGGNCGCGQCGDFSDHDQKNHHKHEHEEVDEFVFTTRKNLDLEKFQEWVLYNFPKNIVRSKGFLKSNNSHYPAFLFQMVGAKRQLVPFVTQDQNFDKNKTRIVFIGKCLDVDHIKSEMKKMEV
jgi:G3E family GTPase